MKSDCNILHLEDDDNDSMFFERALSELHFAGQYRRISTVQEAIDYFIGEGVFADRAAYPLPDVLVADSALGAGKTTGYLMEWLDKQEKISDLIRIVFSGNDGRTEQEKWLTRGVTRVLSKGSNLDDFTVSIKEILRHCG